MPVGSSEPPKAAQGTYHDAGPVGTPRATATEGKAPPAANAHKSATTTTDSADDATRDTHVPSSTAAPLDAGCSAPVASTDAASAAVHGCANAAPANCADADNDRGPGSDASIALATRTMVVSCSAPSSIASDRTGNAVGDGVPLAVGEFDDDADKVELIVGVGLPDGVCVGDGLDDGVHVGEALEVSDGVAGPVREGVTVAVPD